MTIETSDFISFFSLFVAFVAYRHTVTSSRDNAKQIQELSNTHLKLSSNIALSKASRKYVSLLKNVNLEFEEIVKKLADSANNARKNISDIFDVFDTQNQAHPYLRHAFYEAITVVRKAYDKELTYQTGLGLAFQLRTLKSKMRDVVTSQCEKPDRSIFAFFRKQAKLNGPVEIIEASTVFWGSLKTIYDRIPEEKEVELFHLAHPYIEEYSRLHRESRQRLEELEKQLEDAIKENSLEMFKISDIPSLGTKFLRVKGDINRVREFNFLDLHGLDKISVHHGIAYSLYAASVLFIVSDYFSWGKT